METPSQLKRGLATLKRPLHTKAHGEHKYDLCPVCLAAIDRRSVEVKFPRIGKLVLGNLGTGRKAMSNRKLTFFERLNIDTDIKRSDTESNYLNSTQVELILEYLGIKNEDSNLENFQYDYGGSSALLISDEEDKAPKDDLLMNISLQYQMSRFRRSGGSNEQKEYAKARSSVESGQKRYYLKSLEDYGRETKRKRRQETMLAIKQKLQPANDPIAYSPFWDKKPVHNDIYRLILQQMKNEVRKLPVIATD